VAANAAQLLKLSISLALVQVLIYMLKLLRKVLIMIGHISKIKSPLSKTRPLAMVAFHFCLILGLTGCTQTEYFPNSSNSEDSDTGSVAIPPVVNFMESGDLVVTNNTSDVALLLDSGGGYKGVVKNLLNNSETVYGVSWIAATEEVALSIDGSDRIIAIKTSDGSERTVISDAALSGALRGITQLSSSKDYLIIESNNIERYSFDGFRVTGGWPLTNLVNSPRQISDLSTGGFLLCAAGSGEKVSVYDDSGSEIFTTTSGIPNTRDATGCAELADGRIAVSWSGTTDTVAIYSADLSMLEASYTGGAGSVLQNPYGIAQRSNGNLLIADSSLHHIVEIDLTGSFVGVLADTVLSTPRHILVIP